MILHAPKHAGRKLAYTAPGSAPTHVHFDAGGKAEVPDAHGRHLIACGRGEIMEAAPTQHGRAPVSPSPASPMAPEPALESHSVAPEASAAPAAPARRNPAARNRPGPKPGTRRGGGRPRVAEGPKSQAAPVPPAEDAAAEDEAPADESRPRRTTL